MTIFVLSVGAHVSFFHSSNLPYRPVRGKFVPDVSTIVPLPLVFSSPHWAFRHRPSSPDTFGNDFTQKGQSDLYPHLPGLFLGRLLHNSRPTFLPLSSEAEKTKHSLSLPPLDPFEGLYGPRPILTPEGEDGKHVVH